MLILVSHVEDAILRLLQNIPQIPFTAMKQFLYVPCFDP
jgi:hypothetical protein